MPTLSLIELRERKRGYDRKWARSEKGRAYYCAYARKWRADHPEWAQRLAATSTRSGNLRRMYQMTIEEYDTLVAEQGGVCKVCLSPQVELGINKRVKRLVVDHDHKTGKRRGLLCSRCNRAMGLLKDDPVILRALIRYLETP